MTLERSQYNHIVIFYPAEHGLSFPAKTTAHRLVPAQENKNKLELFTAFQHLELAELLLWGCLSDLETL